MSRTHKCESTLTFCWPFANNLDLYAKFEIWWFLFSKILKFWLHLLSILVCTSRIVFFNFLAQNSPLESLPRLKNHNWVIVILNSNWLIFTDQSSLVTIHCPIFTAYIKTFFFLPCAQYSHLLLGCIFSSPIFSVLLCFSLFFSALLFSSLLFCSSLLYSVLPISSPAHSSLASTATVYSCTQPEGRLHCTELLNTSVYCTTLHCIALHCIALHFNKMQ